MARLLKKGDRIRLKVRTIMGWKGTGTVTSDQVYKDNTIQFKKDRATDGSITDSHCFAARHEVALLRDPAKDKAKREKKH